MATFRDLKSIINGKLVVLIAASPTASFLVKNRDRFAHMDDSHIVFCSFSCCEPLERDILLSINKKLSVILLPKYYLEKYPVYVREFLLRSGSCLIVEDRDDVSGLSEDRVLIMSEQCKKEPEEASFLSKKLFEIGFPLTGYILMGYIIVCNPKVLFIFANDIGITEDFTEEDKLWCHYGCTWHAVGPEKANLYKQRAEKWDLKILDIFKEACEIADIKFPPVYLAGLYSNHVLFPKITRECALDLIDEYYYKDYTFRKLAGECGYS